MANPGITTLATMRTAAAQMADMPTPTSSTFVPISEWNTYINICAAGLYDKLIAAYGSSYWYGKTATFATDGTNFQFNLTQTASNGSTFAGSPIATDYYIGLGVDLQYVTSQPQSWVTLRPFAIMERNRWSFPTYLTVFGWTNLHYCYFGDQLWLKPTPQSGQNIQLLYAPRYVALVNDTDTFDGINGWDSYVVFKAAIFARQKQESDTGTLEKLLAEVETRLDSIKHNRDASSPGQVVDTSWSNASGYGTGGGMGGDGGSWY